MQLTLELFDKVILLVICEWEVMGSISRIQHGPF